jgi:hypothetical protein
MYHPFEECPCRQNNLTCRELSSILSPNPDNTPGVYKTLVARPRNKR